MNYSFPPHFRVTDPISGKEFNNMAAFYWPYIKRSQRHVQAMANATQYTLSHVNDKWNHYKNKKRKKITWLVNSADSLWPLTTMAFVSQVSRFKVLLWRSRPTCVGSARLAVNLAHNSFTELSNLDPVPRSFHNAAMFIQHPIANNSRQH